MKASRVTYRAVAYYAIPMLFCVAVHWLALKTWFFQDDFAWLSLRLDPRGVWHAIFTPKAEGTIRIFSERLYFLVFSSLFALNIVPFKIWAFLTQLANIALLLQIARRLTGSGAAGFIAAILWTMNAGLALALGWTSGYDEIAFAFVVLLAFRLFLHYIDTGQRKYWILQWLVFLLGFGVLELNVVYPVLAAGYALGCARQYFRKTLYLFIPSAVFIAAHFAFIPAPADPHYRMYFGSTPITMLWKYLAYSLGALRLGQPDWRPLWLGLALAILITLLLAIFAAGQAGRRNWLGLFLLCWFFVVIAPVLPFRNHFTEYYVVVPSIGLSILAGWALANMEGLARAGTAVVALLYSTVSLTDLHATEKYFYNRARLTKHLVLGLQALPRDETSRTILIDGVDNNLFWSAISDNPFRLLGISRIYLTPGSETSIDPHPEWGGIGQFVISRDHALSLLVSHQAIVVALEGPSLRVVTDSYIAKARFASQHPEFVAVADPLYSNRLGPTWFESEQTFRWMPKTATVKIAGPRRPGQILEITGYAPASILSRGPLGVSFRGDGIAIGSAKLAQPDQHFDLKFSLPSALIGRPWLELQIEVSRTTKVGRDPRPLGLVLQTFTIR